jgi:hypothetical protein
LFAGLATPLYLGRDYAAGYAVLMAPGSWNDTNITASVLTNISDRSWLARLDYQVRVLTYLSVNAYGTYHFGHEGELPTGVFPIGVSDPSAVPTLPGGTQVLDVGLAVRLQL